MARRPERDLPASRVLYVNPKGESRRWESYTVTDRMSCEFMLLKDVDGDGKPEFLFRRRGACRSRSPIRANPTGLWTMTYDQRARAVGRHGMGVGDVNGDGRADFLNAFGWWEQPAPASNGEMTMDVSPGGVRPLDRSCLRRRRDGGLRRQRRRPERRRHVAAGARLGPRVVRAEESRGGEHVAFVETRSWTTSDEERRRRRLLPAPRRHVCRCRRRRIPDFIIGKRFWSHLDNYTDPDPYGPPVLYVFRTSE